MAGLETLGYFTVMGFLGGLAYCFIWAESWNDVKSFKYSKRMILGAIIGFLYNFLHSEYNYPNFVMSFVAGYMGTDAIVGLIEKLVPKKPAPPG